MISIKRFVLFLVTSSLGTVYAQTVDTFLPDNGKPKDVSGMRLVWHDEFNIRGKPDTSSWRYETGFVRNQELQCYQPENAK